MTCTGQAEQREKGRQDKNLKVTKHPVVRWYLHSLKLTVRTWQEANFQKGNSSWKTPMFCFLFRDPFGNRNGNLKMDGTWNKPMEREIPNLETLGFKFHLKLQVGKMSKWKLEQNYQQGWTIICVDYWLYNVISWLENSMEKRDIAIVMFCWAEFFFFGVVCSKVPPKPHQSMTTMTGLIGELGKQTKNVA